MFITYTSLGLAFPFHDDATSEAFATLRSISLRWYCSPPGVLELRQRRTMKLEITEGLGEAISEVYYDN